MGSAVQRSMPNSSTRSALPRRVRSPVGVSCSWRRAKSWLSLSKKNPGLAIGGAAVGFLAGILLPSTRVDDEKLGEVSDQVVDRVKETGQDALDRGRQVAQDTPASAKDNAFESGAEQSNNVAEELKATARDVAQAGSSTTSRGAGCCSGATPPPPPS